MAVPDSSASRIQSEKQHDQCSEETRVNLKDFLRRKGTIPSDGPVIKKSKTVSPVGPSDDKSMDSTQDQKNNEQETGRVVEQEQIALLQGKLPYQKRKVANKKGKVPHGKVPFQCSRPEKSELPFRGQQSSVSAEPTEEKWINWQTKEPSPSPAREEMPELFDDCLQEQEAAACGRGDTNGVCISVSAGHLDHTYGERGKQRCEMVVSLSQKVEPENTSAKVPQIDELLPKLEGVRKILQEKLILRKTKEDDSYQQ